MEDGIFPRPAVAEMLKKRFVEARLHVDYEENMQRELRMTGSNAQPVYLVLDPETEDVHARQDGGLALTDPTPFIDFLLEGWNSARGGTVAE